MRWRRCVVALRRTGVTTLDIFKDHFSQSLNEAMHWLRRCGPWLSAKGDMDIVLSISCMGFTNDPVL